MGTDIKIASLSDWIFTNGKPLVIAGPCSAESEDQLLRTARKIAKIPQVQVFRSGIWKPRTRPGEFEGVGNKGLKWLQKVKAWLWQGKIKRVIRECQQHQLGLAGVHPYFIE